MRSSGGISRGEILHSFFDPIALDHLSVEWIHCLSAGLIAMYKRIALKNAWGPRRPLRVRLETAASVSSSKTAGPRRDSYAKIVAYGPIDAGSQGALPQGIDWRRSPEKGPLPR